MKFASILAVFSLIISVLAFAFAVNGGKCPFARLVKPCPSGICAASDSFVDSAYLAKCRELVDSQERLLALNTQKAMSGDGLATFAIFHNRQELALAKIKLFKVESANPCATPATEVLVDLEFMKKLAEFATRNAEAGIAEISQAETKRISVLNAEIKLMEEMGSVKNYAEFKRLADEFKLDTCTDDMLKALIAAETGK